ncbi:FadR/GntR family transcriptional regulator [Amycolatopsis magusensis]|uniref:FadR/GntR family transcriptional regulator n=1 Tax=Amycolatopsis magusensis TaxID=882444 RepID=UPI003C2FAC65
MTERRPRGLHEQTVEALATRILADEWPEGAVLDLPTLRQELDISLTALREALKVLSAKGMIGARQKHGTFVQPRSRWNMLDADVMRWQIAAAEDSSLLDELSEVRAVVEPAAARLAATRATPDDVAALEDALLQMADAGSDVDAAVRADLLFHRRLMAATHNSFLVRMERIIAIGLAERDRIVHSTPAAGDPVPNHRAVLTAIATGDPAAAERAMATLITQARTDATQARP